MKKLIWLIPLFMTINSPAQDNCKKFLDRVGTNMNRLEQDRQNFFSSSPRFYNRTNEDSILAIVDYLECRGK